MGRRRAAEKRHIVADTKFNSITVSMFINKIMQDGKKALAESIMYKALDIVSKKTGNDPLEVFNTAINNVKPSLEVKTRKVGGMNLRVPEDVKDSRGRALANEWIIKAAKAGAENTMSDKLAREIVNAANNNGGAINKKNETHKTAEANRAFAHFRRQG